MSVCNHVKSACLFASLTLLSANQAFAFTLTRIRVPDWMDPYMAMFLVFSLFGYLGLVVTKPRGVPVKQLSRVKFSPLANFFRVFFGTMFLIFMAMLFVGMALRRYAE
ncbi:drug/metabolite transporter (DMT)-like permease [Rhizobium aethiopicum]|uniref:Drug/metabolite transporter (DMT)-like permease n=1 Tax=Rhizobium aethiopicum TaxID=1138170 RepID=A0A7W6QA38_9HYPH|nr:drug/metabolite transporter (DMT)-like permease [Rhizobium aethiopicum]MBB4579906.1 drug/metabolite transporter (DMT)-like permease [Rhizobium aethiopicum]